MGLSYRASRVLERLHTAIQTRGQHGLDYFRCRLHEQCLDGKKREATERDFVAAAGDGGVLSQEEARVLFRELSGNGKDSSVAFAEILRALRPPTSPQRVALTRAVFDLIDQDRDGLLSPEEIIACYRSANHPSVRRGERTSAEVRQDCIQTLSDVTRSDSHRSSGAMVSFPAFLDFYSSLTAFASDVDFRDAIVAVWAPPAVLDNEHVFHTLGGAGGLVANLRSQILANGLSAIVTFCRGIRNAAARVDGDLQEIRQEAFRAAASRAGAALTASEMNQAFRHLDRRGTGTVLVADALRAVRGEVNARRARAIDDAFDSLLFGHGDDGGHNSETLDPTTVAKLFRAEAHPDVVSGARAQGEVLSEFLEAFEGGGEIGGRVTRSEWRGHHMHVSALIADDDLFCEHIKRVWGCGHREEADLDPSSSVHNHVRSSGGLPRTDRNSSSPRSSSVRGQEGASAFVESNNGNNAAALQGNGCEKTSPRPALAGAREAWGPPLPPQLGSNAERGPILWRGNMSARDGTATRLAMPPGILSLLERARGSLATGGMRAAFQLLRGFREEDRRGNGKVTLSGFKKAMGGSSLGLKEAEMRIVFQHFDQEGDGNVPYELFLRHIRHTLPERRLALAHQVFDRMDTDGDGLVHVDDIVRNFRSHAHPEVADGSREEEDVRREFLESFSVTDGSHRWCTRDDLIWWMELLSASLPTPAADLRFDSLVRACWDVPAEVVGVPGRPGNSAPDENQPVSVVVTHADGSMSIETMSRQEVEVSVDGNGYLSISEEQAERVRRKLCSRGVHAVHVHLLNNNNNNNNNPRGAGADRSAQGTVVANDAGSVLEGGSRLSPRNGGRRPSPEEIKIAKLGPSGDRHGSHDAGCFDEGEAGLGFNHGLLSVLQVARKRLALRGPAGFFSLSRRLRSAGYFRQAVPPCHPAVSAASAAVAAASSGVVNADPGGVSGPFLSLRDFKGALSEIGCGLTGKDLTNVFMHLDEGGRDEILAEVALEAIRGRLVGTRLSLVRAAFTRLRGSGDAPADAAPAVNVAIQFDPTGHPDVMASRRPPEDVRKEFLDAMTTTDGFVTRKDFESYYTDVSAATPSDDFFSLQVQACWGLGPAAASCAVSTSIVHPAATTAAAGENNMRHSGDYDPAYTRRTYSKARTSAPPGVLPGTSERSTKARATGRAGSRSAGRTPTAGVAAILRKLGAEVQGHGAAWGLARLRRALFDADRNKDGFLSFGDLKAALASSRAGLTTAEIRALFTHLETEGGPRRAGGGGGDASGVAPWQALLDATRPRLSGERLGLVRLAFGKMDKEGKGTVSPETVKNRFDASRHPAVLRGHATVEEVSQELLDTFFSAGGGEGGVTEEDFIEHHANLSFGVKGDADFRELVISCWGLDGGGGAGGDKGLPADVADVLRRAHAPHRKFLVSYADGSQCVEDLPFLTTDPEEGEAEASLTAAEENALKRELLKRDNIHATQVTLLPLTYPGAAAPGYLADNSPASTKANPKPVDRRPAWTWAPMSLSEIQAAGAAATTGGGITSGHEDADKNYSQKGEGLDETPASVDPSDRESEEWPPAGQSVECDRIVDPGGKDWEGEEGDGGGAGGRARQRLKSGGRRMRAGQGREPDLSVRYLIAKLRSELNTRGVAGTANLTCRLREAAVLLGGKGNCQGVGEIDFRRALRDADLPLTESDTRRIFAHFEMGQSGVMNLGAFMDRLGGRMDDRRAAFVDEAFDKLDTSGNGHLALDEIIDAFDATKHPDLVSGYQAPDSVYRDFVDGFVAGFPPERRDEAKATKEDFRRYYDVISATIPDDGHFELLLRTCWRMPRRAGANTGSTAPSGGANDAKWGRLRQQEPNDSSSFGRSRRHFRPIREGARDAPKIGNDHYSSPPAILPPNEGREGSFKILRESRAAGSGLGGRSSVGPSDENRMLRSAVLSRTFDSQICFGSVEGEEEVVGRFQRPPAPGNDDDGRPPPPPAGGGRVGRVAEGAAWTPGGRRLIPGSKAFVSHLGSGMMAKKDACVEDDDEASSTNSSNTISMLLSARKSRARAAARAPPVWIPKPDPKSSTPVAVAADTSGKAVVNDKRLSGSISLAQLMDSDRDSHSRHGRDQHTADGRISPDDKHRAPSPSTPAVERNLSANTNEKRDEGRYSDQPSVYAVTEKARAFDWWGGAGVSDTDAERERVVRGSGFTPRPKTVSDTYKSSLVFG